MTRSLLVLTALLFGCAPKGASRPVVVAQVAQGLEMFDIQGAIGAWAPDPARRLMPVGVGVRVGDITAWSYVDPEAGLSVRWSDGVAGSPGSVHIRRLSWAPAGLQVLDGAEPEAWLEAYGAQPAPGTLYGAWRTVPGLAHRLHPDYPDDLRAIIGETRGEKLVFEVVWVSLRACDGLRCEGSLLNQPDGLPAIALGSRLVVDVTGVANDRLPVAAPPGVAPDPELVAWAARAPEVAGLLMDPDIWVPDYTLPPEQRLVPLGRWGFVGEHAVWLFLGAGGPQAVVVGPEGALYQSLTWAPRGLREMTVEERVRLGLPEVPTIQGAPPQPPPGPWGAWRVDPATAWLFTTGDPDVANVVVDTGEALAQARIFVTGCDALSCWGPLLEPVGRYEAGRALQLRHTRVGDAAVPPIAWPVGEQPPTGLPR